jgi:hypothetical protein
MITAFKNIWAKEPNYISIEYALKRIKEGKSKSLVDEIRNTLDKEKAGEIEKTIKSLSIAVLLCLILIMFTS